MKRTKLKKNKNQNPLKLQKRKIKMKQHTKTYIHRNRKNFQKGNKARKGINDYQFYIGTNKQSAEYEIAAEFIINFIKRTFD